MSNIGLTPLLGPDGLGEEAYDTAPPTGQATPFAVIDASIWPAIPAARQPNPHAGRTSPPQTQLTPRLSEGLHIILRYALVRWSADYRLPEVSPSSGSEWLTRLGLSHIDDPDLLRLVHSSGKFTPTQLRLAEPHPPAGEDPAPGWDAELSGKLKALCIQWPAALIDQVNDTLRDWKATHPPVFFAYGTGRGLNRQGFIEGLIRLGLKHIADPNGRDLLRP